MDFFILIISSITVIITTGLIIKNVSDKRRNDIEQKKLAAVEQCEKLIKNLIEHGNETDLIALKERQVVISNEQKLQILLNAYSANRPSAIQYLKDLDYKLNLNKILEMFLDKKEPAQLEFFLINFLEKKSDLGYYNITSFQPVIAELFSKNALDVVSLLLDLFPVHTFNALLLLIEHEKNETVLKYISDKKQWLQANSSVIINEIRLKNITDTKLINFLLNVFPDGELESHNLCQIIYNLIDHKINDHDLFTRLCNQMDFLRLRKLRGPLAGRINYLEHSINHSLMNDRLDVFELLIQSNRDLLSENTDEANKIIQLFVHRNQKVAEIFFRNGLSVNRNMPNHISIVERSIIDCLNTREENQSILDMLLTYGLDLNTKISKNNRPNNIDELTLLGFLVFTDLIIKNNPDFNALKLQKFIALFFDIPGTSYSNGTLCVHGSMRQRYAYAHWNDLLDLYFKNLNTTSIDTELNQCLDRLYSLDGIYDNQSTYDRYNQGKPIVLPVNLRGCMGEAHIATVGFIKLDSHYHLRVEADRGCGRNDFSIYKEPVLDFYTLSRYTHTCINPIPLEELWQCGPQKKINILTIHIGKQKSQSCASISVKYAFHIAHFLCEIHNRNFSFALEFNEQKTLLNEVYQISDHWFKDFLISTQQLLLQKYQELESKYIDIDFLAKIEKESIIKPEEIDNGTLVFRKNNGSLV
jgi:hypothetical protein